MQLKLIDVDFRNEKVIRVNPNITPSVQQVIANLLDRQQRIINGKVSYVNKDNLIGVNVKAQLDTVETVPYLTHLDYVRAVRELTEFSDFTVLNLADDVNTSGIQQYYKKDNNSLDKLLKNVQRARVNELGKVAALQYEKHLEKS